MTDIPHTSAAKPATPLPSRLITLTEYAKVVPDCNNQSLQNAISESPWDERPVIDQIQRDVTELIGDSVNGSIHVDESGFVKKETESVGVKRQYCGRL